MKTLLRPTFIIFMMLLITFLIPSFMSPVTIETKTDWVITSPEVIQDKTLIVKGGIIIKAGGTLELQNVTLLMDDAKGILAENGATFTVVNSKLSSNTPGKTFYPIVIHCDGATIEKTQIAGLGNGTPPYMNPLVITGKNATINQCQIGGAISLYKTSQCTLTNNKLYQESTPAMFYAMIQLTQSNDNTLTGNTEYGGLNGIYCIYSWGNQFDNNTWYAQEEKYIGTNTTKWWNETFVNGSVAGNGIWLNEMSNNNVVTNNKSYGPSCSAFRITQSSANTFKYNQAKGTRVGLVMLFAQNNIIDSNSFSDIWEYEAIQMYRTHNNTIINNTIKQSQVGIALQQSKNETVSGNSFIACGKAITLFNANRNMVTLNSASDCISGIVVDWSKDNTLSNNNFINGKLPAFISTGNLIKGNYWSGTTSTADKLLDKTFSKTLNKIVKISAPVLVPVEYIEKSTEGIRIEQDTLWENQTIELKGTLTILQGAKLTMKNVTLIYKPDNNAVDHSVITSYGGDLAIYNSKLIGPEFDKLLSISIRDADNLIIKNTELHNMGAWDGAGAVEIQNVKSVDIQSNLFSGCYQAAKIFNCPKVIFSSNTIINVREGLNISPNPNSTLMVQNNKVNQAAYHGIRIWSTMSRLSNTSVISGNTFTNIWGDGLWCSADFLGKALQKNNFSNVRGPSLLSCDNLLLDGRTYRPIAINSSYVKKGQPITLYFTVAGVRRVLVKTTDSVTTVQLTLNGKVIQTKKLVIKSGQLNTVSFSLNAPETGTYGLDFGDEKEY